MSYYCSLISPISFSSIPLQKKFDLENCRGLCFWRLLRFKKKYKILCVVKVVMTAYITLVFFFFTILNQTLFPASSTILSGNYKHLQSSHFRDLETEAQQVRGGEVTCSRSHSWFGLEPELDPQASESLSIKLSYLRFGNSNIQFLESRPWPFHVCVLIV